MAPNRPASKPQRVTLPDLISAGFLQPGEQFVFENHAVTLTATGDLYVGSPDTIPIYLRSTYPSLSSWCSDVKRRGDRSSNVTVSGWVKAKLAANPAFSVDSVRKQYLAHLAGLHPTAAPAVDDSPPLDAYAGLHQTPYSDDEPGRKFFNGGAMGIPSDESDPEFDAVKYERAKRMEARRTSRPSLSTTAKNKPKLGTRKPHSHTSETVRRATGSAVSKLSQSAARHMGHVIQHLNNQRTTSGDWAHQSLADHLPSFNAKSPPLLTTTPETAHPVGFPDDGSDMVPTPSVVVFPLPTDTLDPNPDTFRASLACIECSAVIHPGQDHLTCGSCSEAHHIHCTPLYICPPPPLPHAGRLHCTITTWTCIFCTFCSKCDGNSPRDQLARCSQCLGVFHLDCTSVSAELIAPDGTIVCSACAKCWSCGLVPAPGATLCPPAWDRHPVTPAYQCKACTQCYRNGHFCPVCLKAYAEDDFDTPMLGCDGPCGKWIHKACDPALAGTEYNEITEDGSDYLCPVCRGDPIPDLHLLEPGPPAPSATSTFDNVETDFGLASRPDSADHFVSDFPMDSAFSLHDTTHSLLTDPPRPNANRALMVPMDDPMDGLDPMFISRSPSKPLETVDQPLLLRTSSESLPLPDCPGTEDQLAPVSAPGESELAMRAYVEQRTCAFCGHPEMQYLLKRGKGGDPNVQQDDGIGRLVFIGGNDPGGMGTGQWAHSGCVYWSIPPTVPDAVIDERLVLGALEAVADVQCALCHHGCANIACGHPAGCSTAYHWSCLVRAMYGSGFKSLSQVPPLQGYPGLPNETKKAKRAHVDVYTHDVRCQAHLSTALANLSARKPVGAATTVQPTIDECNRVCRMRMAIAHEPTVPLYVSAVPAPRPGKLLTTAPPYGPACLVVGGAVITHIGRLPYSDPNLLIEQDGKSHPWLIPVGYTVVRRFWSYRYRGSVTYIIMTRVVAGVAGLGEGEELLDKRFGLPPPSSTIGDEMDVNSKDRSDDQTVDSASVGTVVYGELAQDTVVVDNYQVTPGFNDQLVWDVRIADDAQGSFQAKTTGEILPHLLSQFDPPLPVSKHHHFLTRPESFVLLHHPTIVRFIENLPHAAQVTSYPLRYVDPLSVSKIRDTERGLRRGSSRTDPAVCRAAFRSTRIADQSLSLSSSAATTLGYMSGCNAGAAPILAHASGTGAPIAAVGQTMGASWDSSVPLPIQYQRLKEAEKVQVMVRPSKIQGVGLFALRQFHPSDMVIEYVGEVISQKVADVRELINERMGVGTYLFALAHDRIVDATRMGNTARFINHSCDPNCYARIVSPRSGVKRVIFFAARRIEVGDELTYDYMFQREDDPAKKVPCYCAAAACRRFIN